MYTLFILLFLPIINTLVTVEIHRNTLYDPQSWCAFIRNASWLNDVSIQSCIWECVYEYDCQTAVYYKNERVCSMFAELSSADRFQSSGNIQASVIRYKKNHSEIVPCKNSKRSMFIDPIITCSTTVTTNEVQDDKASTTEMITAITTASETASTLASYSTTLTTTTTSITACTSRIPNVTTILYDFDQEVYDVYSNDAGRYNGVPTSSSTYISPGITGYGYAMSFSSSSAQFVTIPNWINLSNMSFTIEFWMNINSINGDLGIFGQCQTQSTDYCLHIIVRSGHIFFSFYLNYVTGGTTLTVGIWYHIACVYDVNSQVQLIYLNGIQDGSHTNATPFLAYNTTSTIGVTYNNSFNAASYFSGMIDQLSITQNYAKNASFVLDDATLTAYFSFDSPSDFSCDNGPNFLNGTYNNLSSVTGRVGKAIAFSATNASYFQIDNKFVLLALQNQAHSYALWINPQVNSGTILQENSANSSIWSMLPFGYTSDGKIVAHVWNGNYQFALGAAPILNSWTHIAMTYDRTLGLSLYMNGSLYSTSSVSPLDYNAPPTPTATLTLGYTSQVNVPGLAAIGQFVGAIDELRVYSRALSVFEVAQLANP